MSKVTIRATVLFDEADYDKILAFAETNENAKQWLDMSKQIEEMLEFNLKSLVAQITKIEAQVGLEIPEKPKIVVPG